MQHLGVTGWPGENQYLLNSLPIPIAVLKGAQHKIEFANDAMLGFWRRTAEITIGLPLDEVFPELDPLFFHQLNQVISSGEDYKLEEVLLTLNDQHGSPYTIYINYTYQPIRDQNELITGVLVTAMDVTHKVNGIKALRESTIQLEQANQALNTSNQECLMAIETAKLGTWKYNAAANLLQLSARASEIFGLADTDLSFPALIDMIPEEFKQMVMVTFAESFKNLSSLDAEFPVIHKQLAGERWIRLSGRVIEANNQSGTVMDITNQKMETIRKNQFISMVSHELKTPLTSLTGLVQLTKRKLTGEKDEQTNQILTKSLHQISKMTRMINSFLSITRLESGKFEMDMTEFDMEELISEYLSEAQMTSSSHDFLQHNCESVKLFADRGKIGAVLANLVSNSIKYSPRGTTITVSCKRDGNNLEVSVHDQGSGIIEKDRKRVFEQFSHIENPHIMNSAGFGIGLHLSSEIIKRHQGKIWVENNPDAGCTFHFKLPLLTN